MAIALSGSLILSGSITVSGSIISTGTISMSGSIASASYANNATSASYANNATSASYALNATTGAYANTATSASYALNATTFNGLASSIFATTGSNTFIGTQTITGSVLQSGSFTTTGTIIAQTINVQQVTSSIVYSCGSNIFGTNISNTQQLTGSVGITGSLTIAGASSATSYNGATIFGSTIACSPIGCFATSCATSFIGGTMSGTTIYGSTAVCSPVGKFTSCIDAGSGTFSSSVTANGLYANAGNSARFYRSANDYYWGIHNDSNNYLNFGTYLANGTAYGTNPKVILLDNGNVGIGTSSPSYKLDVQNGSDFDIRLRDTSLGGTVGIVFESANDFSGTSQSYIKGIGAGNSGVSQLIFGTAGGSGDTTATERMRITGGGNVGIGVNPSAWTLLCPVQIRNVALAGYTTGNTHIFYAGSNWYYGGGDKYITNGFASLYSQADGAHVWYNAGCNVSGADSALTFTERMRITCGGVIKVKNTTIPEGDDIGLIQVENTTAAAGSGANAGITVKSYNGTAQIMQWENYGIRLGNRIKTNTGAGGVYFTYGNDTVGMILTSGGHVTKPCSAAFHASINTTTCIGIGGRQIQFNCVLYNAGNAYDGTTSTFTAPVSGMYQFNFVFLNQNVQNTTGGHGYISTNYGVGTYYFSRFGCQSGEHGTGYGGFVPMQGSVAVYLPSGYKACVGAFWDADGAFTHVSTAWASFTGYLVG